MCDLAPQADGIAAHRGQKRAPRFRDIARKAQIAHPVRCFGQLAQEVARQTVRDLWSGSAAINSDTPFEDKLASVLVHLYRRHLEVMPAALARGLEAV